MSTLLLQNICYSYEKGRPRPANIKTTLTPSLPPADFMLFWGRPVPAKQPC